MFKMVIFYGRHVVLRSLIFQITDGVVIRPANLNYSLCAGHGTCS